MYEERTVKQWDTTLQRLVDLADDALRESKKWLEKGQNVFDRYHQDKGDQGELVASCARMSEAWMRVAEYHRETSIPVREARQRALQREQAAAARTAADEHDGDGDV